MPLKSQQRIPSESVRLQGRTNTVTTTTSKGSISATKRNGGPPRIESTVTTNSDSISNILANHFDQIDTSPSIKIIEEVDDSNIDEVLALTDPALIPSSFITELRQDEIYATILEELEKKFHQHFLKTSEEPQLLSPHLLRLPDRTDGDNDELMINDDVMSTYSNESPEDYDTDIEPEMIVKEEHDQTGRTQYAKMCQKKKVIPCSYFMAHIEDTEMILRYHQFNTEDFSAIAKALCNNIHVESLHLDGNYLQEQSAKHIARLLLTNDFITDLSLADNRLGGGRGTQEICRMLTLSQNLKRINLSGNMFNEVDVVPLVEAFEQNKVLLELNLSRNRFGEEAGKVLGSYLSGNYTLEAIDLSWNRFRGKSAIDLLQGVKENTFLKRCNLSMNGFGPEAGQILADCIKHNSALVEFNISGNRLNTASAFSIAQAFLENKTLEVLKIADNDINTDGILALLFSIKISTGNSLRELDLSHMVITKDIQQICKDIAQMKEDQFVCHLGKEIQEMLAPNSMSEYYTKTNLDVLKRLGREAGYTATEKDPRGWITFT